MKIKVEALKDHTYNGKSYAAGDTYDFEPAENASGISADDQVQSLLNTGFAIRVDHAEHTRKVQKDAEKSAEKSKADEKKTAVEPMTTTGSGKAIAKPQAKK